MKTTHVGSIILAALLSSGAAWAQGPAGTVSKGGRTENPIKRPKKQFVVRAAIAAATCGVGIGVTGNPATAAEIGIPILVGGNALAYKLYQNHPNWSAFIQTLSPLGCFSPRLGGHPRAQVHKGTPPPPKTSGSSGVGASNGSGSGSSSGAGSSSGHAGS